MKLSDQDVIAMVATKDLEKAKEFYGETLGLKQTDKNDAGVTFASGSTRLFVYPTPTAGTAQSTTATWEVTNIEDVVKELSDNGVTFEHYEIPGATQVGDISHIGPHKAAWFKDPDGNILGLTQVAAK